MNVVCVSHHGRIKYATVSDVSPEFGRIDGAPVRIFPAYFHSDGSFASYMCDGLCHTCHEKHRGDHLSLKLKGCRGIYGKDRELHIGMLAEYEDPEQEAELLDFIV